MPSPAPLTPEQCTAQLQALGAQIRAQRKALRLSATVTAEAAGLSRVTLHRIEKGEPSVTMGAWCNAMAALGMGLQATPSAADAAKPAPAGGCLADYPAFFEYRACSCAHPLPGPWRHGHGENAVRRAVSGEVLLWRLVSGNWVSPWS